jgi:hypothetical protein
MFLPLLLYILEVVAAAEGGNGRFDLTQNGMNSAGIGFSFRDSESMQKSKQFVSLQMPTCSIGPLDAVYFYVYGCSIPSEMIGEMADYVGEGFLFTSDKSITMLTEISNSSLLLANAWDLSLEYSSQEACLSEFDTVLNSSGCVAINDCVSEKQRSVTVGCGSMACTGCVLDDFFASYLFDTAAFVMMEKEK